MRKILNKKFFERDALIVARELIGKYLVRQIGEQREAYKIIETEAYVGPHDLASHSSKGRTKRTEIMFQEGGTIYVYLVYGMHEMLNIVTGKIDYPSAVLIRGVEGAIGPGRVTKKLFIDRALNALPASHKTGLWVEDRSEKINPKNIKKTARIGVDYAGPIWSKKLLRFVLLEK